jgi:hypothetical protein
MVTSPVSPDGSTGRSSTPDGWPGCGHSAPEGATGMAPSNQLPAASAGSSRGIQRQRGCHAIRRVGRVGVVGVTSSNRQHQSYRGCNRFRLAQSPVHMSSIQGTRVARPAGRPRDKQASYPSPPSPKPLFSCSRCLSWRCRRHRPGSSRPCRRRPHPTREKPRGRLPLATLPIARSGASRLSPRGCPRRGSPTTTVCL